MHTLFIATANHNKSAEFRQLFGDRIAIVDMHDLCQGLQIEETGSDFKENAILKAVAAAKKSGLHALADDSGLEVAALNGAPGVFSARYAGPHADDAANRRKLLAELKARQLASPAQRQAQFCCVLALASPTGPIGTWSGIVVGHITHDERGSGGFGYDPLFIPEGESRTFAEMPPEAKHALSHRSRALKLFLNAWDAGQIPGFRPK